MAARRKQGAARRNGAKPGKAPRSSERHAAHTTTRKSTDPSRRTRTPSRADAERTRGARRKRTSAAKLSRAELLGPPDGWERVRVGRSGLHGRGLFATVDLPRGAYVMEYVGERVGKKEGNRRTEAQWARGRLYMFTLNRKVDLDGSVRWNRARLANCSCDPNCESWSERGERIWVKAMRRIPAGTEITYDYNFDFVDPPPRCNCGSPKCRGYIVGKHDLGQLRKWLREHPDAPRGPGLKA